MSDPIVAQIIENLYGSPDPDRSWEAEAYASGWRKWTREGVEERLTEKFPKLGTKELTHILSALDKMDMLAGGQ